MRPVIRNVGIVAGLILVSAVIAPPVSAAPAFQPLKIVKECSKYSGDIGSFCTVTESSLAAIPAGSMVFYYGPVTNSPLYSSTAVVLEAGVGNTAVGYCILDDQSVGLCAFSAGTGTLAGFQALLKVSVADAKQMTYHWDGGYLLGAAK